MTTGSVTSADQTMNDVKNMAPGDVRLLDHPVARSLLQSTIPARVAYTALDGAPRVIAILFHWTGEDIVITSWPDDPKVAAIRASARVAVTIDTADFPFNALSIRGEAVVDIIDGVAGERLPMFSPYFGPDQGPGWVERMRMMSPQQARIAIRPTWVNVVDFQTRFPSGMTRRMRPA